MSSHKLEDRIQAFRWKLGIPGGGEDEAELCRLWVAMQRDSAEFATAVDLAASRLGMLLASAIKAKITGRPSSTYAWAEGLADVFTKWALDNERAVMPKVSGVLRTALDDRSRPLQPPTTTVQHPQAGQPPPRPRPSLTPNPAGPPPKAREYPKSPAMPPPPPLPPLDPPAAPAWRYIEPPATPEPHSEFDARTCDAPPPGMQMIGARVRGKKHKHDGTHCDDWFEFATAGPWTLIAVSDGAGSKKLSRVGARAACKTAAHEMTADLTNYRLAERTTADEWTAALQSTELGPTFPDDLDAVRAALQRAMMRAYESVVAAADERAGKPEYDALLGRPVEVGDLSCTLLLAAHCAVTRDGQPCDFVMACQVGDGICGVIDRDGNARPLGAADSGGYSGETEFLTSSGKLDPEALRRKTVAFLDPMQALAVMTDGVADDYFPAESGLSRLWADLLINGIPEATAADAGGLAGTPLPDADGYSTEFELIVAAEPRPKVRLRSAGAFAEKLGRPVAELLRTPAAFVAAAAPLAGATAAERLRLWLDAYQVRGSFDDRTLVVLHRETLP